MASLLAAEPCFAAVSVNQEPGEVHFAPLKTRAEPALASEVHDSPSYASVLDPHIGDYPEGSDILKLQSRPGAPNVLWLDISDIVQNGAPTTLASKAEVWAMWQVVASLYSAFDLNVTTDAAVYGATNLAKTGHVKFLAEDGRSSCGHHIFGTDASCTVYKQPNGIYLGLVAANVSTHLFGIDNAGGDGTDYFEGFPEYEWVPLSGDIWFVRGWSNALLQFTRREFEGSKYPLDELALILEYLQWRSDDIPGSVALDLQNGVISPLRNIGRIAPSGDVDAFTFAVVQPSRVQFRIERIEPRIGSMLDIEAELADNAGAVLSRSNPQRDRSASFNEVLQPGYYELRVKGGAEGTPKFGFPAYSSLGAYAISGTIAATDDDSSSDETSTSTTTGENTSTTSTGSSSDNETTTSTTTTTATATSNTDSSTSQSSSSTSLPDSSSSELESSSDSATSNTTQSDIMWPTTSGTSTQTTVGTWIPGDATQSGTMSTTGIVVEQMGADDASAGCQIPAAATSPWAFGGLASMLAVFGRRRRYRSNQAV